MAQQFYVRESFSSYRPATADEMSAALRQAAAARMTGDPIENPEAAKRRCWEFLETLGMAEHEIFAAVWLDNRHRVILAEALFRGTIDATSVYPREVVKRALALNAASVIFAHNHPSGDPEPSSADQMLTRRLREALAVVDIKILDHIVIAASGLTASFAERGML